MIVRCCFNWCLWTIQRLLCQSTKKTRRYRRQKGILSYEDARFLSHKAKKPCTFSNLSSPDRLEKQTVNQWLWTIYRLFKPINAVKFSNFTEMPPQKHLFSRHYCNLLSWSKYPILVPIERRFVNLFLSSAYNVTGIRKRSVIWPWNRKG